MSDNQELQVKIFDMPNVPSTLKWVINDDRIKKILIKINSNHPLEGYIKTNQTKVSWILLIYVMVLYMYHA